MGDVDVNFLVVDHDKGIGINQGSKISIWVNLTEDIFDLDSNHDHSVWSAFLMSLFGKTIWVGMLNVDYDAILTIFQQFIEIGHLGLSILLENLESVSLNFISSNFAFQVSVAAFIIGLDETSVHLE